MADFNQAISWNSVGKVVRRRVNRWKFWKKEYRYFGHELVTNGDLSATNWHCVPQVTKIPTKDSVFRNNAYDRF